MPGSSSKTAASPSSAPRASTLGRRGVRCTSGRAKALADIDFAARTARLVKPTRRGAPARNRRGSHVAGRAAAAARSPWHKHICGSANWPSSRATPWPTSSRLSSSAFARAASRASAETTAATPWSWPNASWPRFRPTAVGRAAPTRAARHPMRRHPVLPRTALADAQSAAARPTAARPAELADAHRSRAPLLRPGRDLRTAPAPPAWQSPCTARNTPAPSQDKPAARACRRRSAPGYSNGRAPASTVASNWPTNCTISNLPTDELTSIGTRCPST